MPLPKGWHRGIDDDGRPGMYVEHENKRIRVTKTMTRDDARYTIFIKHGGEWIRPNIHWTRDLAEACSKAEQLHNERKP